MQYLRPHRGLLKPRQHNAFNLIIVKFKHLSAFLALPVNDHVQDVSEADFIEHLEAVELPEFAGVEDFNIILELLLHPLFKPLYELHQQLSAFNSDVSRFSQHLLAKQLHVHKHFAFGADEAAIRLVASPYSFVVHFREPIGAHLVLLA